jgi:ABC-type dipeptide/oligopeptide/nickel transport system permease component
VLTQYVCKRLIALILVLFVVSILAFSILRLIPGDPAVLIAGVDAQPKDVERFRQLLGLDQPVHVQYLRFLGRAVTGDLGRSLRSYQPVTQDLARRFTASFYLAVASLSLSLLIGLPAGVLAAAHRRSLWDNLLMGLSVLGVSMPTFWLGLLLISFFSVQLDWLPTSGFEGPQYIVLPAVTLAAFSLATIARTTRSCMLDVLGQDYIRTARAKGLTEGVVTTKHALKNAVIPLVAVVGLQFGYLLGSSVITETVFTWPGIGFLLVDAIKNRDFPMIQGAVLLIATAFALINLMVDLLYATFDPRIRFA